MATAIVSPVAADSLHYYASRLRHYSRDRRLKRRELLPFTSSGAIFIHIPKTAGISVATALFDADSPGGHKSAINFRRIYGKREFERMFKFAFVREPVDRLSSAWAYLRAGGRGAIPDIAAQEAIADCTSIDEFILDYLPRTHIQQIPHFRPQSDFICDRADHLLVDFVGRYENLPDDFATVADRLGRSPVLPARNRSPDGTARAPLSEEAVRAAVAFYRRDYDLLGYPSH